MTDFNEKRKQFWRLNFLSWEGNKFLSTKCVSTVLPKSCWQSSAHLLKDVNMLFGLLLAQKVSLLREMTVT